MKPIAFYLPQYHEIEENNIWWGEGFTEWDSVKNAKSYFTGHDQPKIPLDNNYYDLSDQDATTWKWQAKLAKENGVYGFCIYHYWFKNSKQLLEKPVKILLEHDEIDINYCFCWANEPWKRTWYSYNEELLMEQEYGSINEWTKHYNYMSTFFKDPRYIKKNNKPVLAIYRCAAIEKLKEMKELWEKLAKKDGFDGIYLISGNTSFKRETRLEIIDSEYRFEPAYTLHYKIPKYARVPSYIRRKIVFCLNKLTNKKSIENVESMNLLYRYMPSKFKENGIKVYPGICPSWDNTPRKKWKGTYFSKSSPNLFKKKLEFFNENLDKDDFIFINAWNEWSEGAYLEPDEKNKYNYLYAIRDVVDK